MLKNEGGSPAEGGGQRFSRRDVLRRVGASAGASAVLRTTGIGAALGLGAAVIDADPAGAVQVWAGCNGFGTNSRCDPSTNHVWTYFQTNPYQGSPWYCRIDVDQSNSAGGICESSAWSGDVNNYSKCVTRSGAHKNDYTSCRSAACKESPPSAQVSGQRCYGYYTY